jgi:hypothetical protein
MVLERWLKNTGLPGDVRGRIEAVKDTVGESPDIIYPIPGITGLAYARRIFQHPEHT